MPEQLSLQETHAPGNACFGCGPANPDGLRIRSFVEGDEVVCRWTPAKRHEAFPGMLNGGICGALLDCHMNWTAAEHLRRDADTPPCTVTAEFSVSLRRPTPTDGELTLRARVVDSTEDRAEVKATIETADGTVTVRGSGTFVAVRPGHPAYHRW